MTTKPTRVYFLSDSDGGPTICILREHDDGGWELREATGIEAPDGKRMYRVGGGSGSGRAWVATLLRKLRKLHGTVGFLVPPAKPTTGDN